MGSYQLRCRISKTSGEDIGMSIMGIMEGEGLNGFMVTGISPNVDSAKWLKPGDRIIYTNGIPCTNLSKFMDGVTHKWFLDTCDVQFFRYIPMKKTKEMMEVELGVATARLCWFDEEWMVAEAPPESQLNPLDIIIDLNGTPVGQLGKPWLEIALEMKEDDKLKLTVQRGGVHPGIESFVPNPAPHSDYFPATFRRKGDTRPLGLFVKEKDKMVVISTSEAGSQAWGVVEPLDRIIAINALTITSSAECGAEMVRTGNDPFRLVIERPRTVGRRAALNKIMSPKIAQPVAFWPCPPPSLDLKTEGVKAPPVTGKATSILLAPGQGGSKRPKPQPEGAAPPPPEGAANGEGSSTASAATAPSAPTAGAASPTASSPTVFKDHIVRAISFNLKVNTTEIYQDVIPKKRRAYG